jgi:hypothetical protein
MDLIDQRSFIRENENHRLDSFQAQFEAVYQKQAVEVPSGVDDKVSILDCTQ